MKGNDDKKVVLNWEQYYRWGLEMKDRGYPNIKPEEYANSMMAAKEKGANAVPSTFARRISKEEE